MTEVNRPHTYPSVSIQYNLVVVRDALHQLGRYMQRRIIHRANCAMVKGPRRQPPPPRLECILASALAYSRRNALSHLASNSCLSK